MKRLKNDSTIVVIALFIGTLFFWGCKPKGTNDAPKFDPEAQPAYLNYNLPIDKRVDDLVSRLTLEEKAAMLDRDGPEIERFHIKSDGWNQNMHGVWWDRPTTLYPVPIAMAATWDTSLVKDVSSTIADESRAIYNWWHTDPNFWGEKRGLIYRQPVINMARNPYWGRNYEIWGEDPHLAGRMSVAYTHGFRGNDPNYIKIAPTAKHFAVNNVEKDRHLVSASVGERWLHEYWLKAFKDAIMEGGVYQIMASYNAINGVPNVMNEHLLTDILRNKWGYKGFVVSDANGVADLQMDWGHNYKFKINRDQIRSGNEKYTLKETLTPPEAVANAMNAGVDFDGDEFTKYIPEAVHQGLLSEDRVDEALARVLRVRFLVGDFDPFDRVPYHTISPDVIGSKAHRQQALDIAQKSMVLLKNQNNFLPLDKDKIHTIAVIGPNSDQFIPGGYTGEWQNAITPLQGIKNRVSNETKVLHAVGGQITPPHSRDDILIDKERQLQKAVDIAKQADVAVLFVGTNSDIESEGDDRPTLGLPGNQLELVQKVYAVNPKTVVVLVNAGPMTIPWVKDHVPAIVEAWIAGEEGGNAMANVLFGNVNPGGKLPFTVYASADQVPPQDDYNISDGFTYMYVNGKPMYPFGYGLSYTKFEYSDLNISAQSIPINGEFTVDVTVENTGSRKGTEVVQLYSHDQQSSVVQPKKELFDFQKVELNPGQKKTITFTVKGDAFSFYDVKSHDFTVDPGVFDIMVGSSSEDIREKGTIKITAN